jgi:sporulation protein YlmC with PRC-barrel domain
MHGKEVINSFGNVLGKVTDISWDESTKKIKFFEIGSAGIMEMLGRGEKKILPFDIIETIGDKILIKTGSTELTKENISNIKNVSSIKVGTNVKDISKSNISKVNDISRVKNFSMKKDTKTVDKVEKDDETVNIDDIENTIEDFRIRNSF